ncbi:MAG: LamG-like jellyroll fold domain-containing protein [Algibacter sp.]
MKQTLFIKILFTIVFFLTNTVYAQDTDGDGINDSVDLDDDNDGIIDTLECQNLLVDSGFDNKTGLNNGNNINVDISPWILGSGDKSNIVKVDGAGGYNYGNGGPFEDANPLTGAGEAQYYLDIASGSNDFYQSFIVASNAKLTYGGYFSSRDGRTGTARLRIFTGNSGSSGTLIADSSTFSVSPIGGDSSNTPWQLFEDDVYITAGTYSFVVSMDNDMNFDEGYTTACLDRDGDSVYDYIDIDSDDDGIPDNVEAQPTIGYIPPSNISSSITDTNNNGLDDVYESVMGGTDLNQLEDTDGDGIDDYLDSDSDNDGTPDIEENGHADTVNNIDNDNDGLHDNLDSVTAHLDVNDEVSTGDVSDLTNSFEDVDGDATLGGDLDYRDLFDVNPPEFASIDFDGIDDYLSRTAFIDGLNNVTIMAWVKSDSGNSIDMTIAGEDTGCRLWLQNGKTPTFTIKSLGNVEKSVNCSAINFDEWHHIAGTYTSATGRLSIYLDGALLSSIDVDTSGAVIENTEDSNGNFEVGRLSSDVANKQYFKGDIDEVRVFNTLLTTDQLSKMVYQEIENNSGVIKGTIVEKDIDDALTNATIPWGSLIAYYPMTDIKTNATLDYSGNNKTLTLYNINTVQDQTAPMPYVSVNNTPWATESTWLYGDVWDIENTATNKGWSIVQIASNVSACHNVNTLGLIVDSGSTLTIHTDILLENDWYLELNGTIDLQGDAQLIQTENSDLVTSATGKILRRQEGTGSAYWYNYWASPVGETGVTSLSDNNAATNNTNNSSFKLNLLKDEAGFNWQFTSGYSGNGSISTYWLYTFKNAVTYWDWAKLSTSASINPGIGYTQKGTGAPTEQQYIFEGKPNNGTILIDVIDTGGVGSVPAVSKTEYLMGNPYPSALDIHKFIDDNEGVIEGTLQLWQQWSGTSHYLDDYNGGYALVNKTGGTRAYQFVGIEGANNGSQDGTKIPTKYLPVGQGFIAEIVANGTVEFNNDQRVFIKESDADGSYETGSVFLKSSSTKNSKTAVVKEEDITKLKKIRLEMKSVSGPSTHRELLLGFSSLTTDAYDYGYEAKNKDDNNNDIHLNFEGMDMNIQAYSEVADDKVVSLNFKSSGDNSFEIKMIESENFDEAQDIYLKDTFTGDYFDLTENIAYSFSSEQGKFNSRFEIVFQSEQKALGIEETKQTENFVYYQNDNRKLYAKKLNTSIKRFALVNMLGQSVLELDNISQNTLENGIDIPTLAVGSYVAYFRSDANEVFSKKMIIN